jgi:hypothetical protein
MPMGSQYGIPFRKWHVHDHVRSDIRKLRDKNPQPFRRLHQRPGIHRTTAFDQAKGVERQPQVSAKPPLGGCGSLADLPNTIS